MSLDPIDTKILAILKNDSRLSHKEIGTMVHRTGQAVGQRITKMHSEGLIKKYSIQLHYDATQFIRVMMQSNRFTEFESFTQQFNAIESSFKVSGSACYMLIAHFDYEALNSFIEQLSDWGQYSVDSVVRPIQK
ncbi:hypothetical protein F975_01951 [Acinetobacter sp. ANC 3789]|uniref:Lrp/AsnC family transcriptional regulator n=1 Tax=Acinetobacter sp. ANC 3789 TaxID=1217714 RepID=UPI0002CF96EB|nr:AsnC family transcriptional regulator [Acinetobacter sp. ANC 3789]ENU80196.1 hypothetical protein F975_01951 [Acinetobacter sp. ANC 3789]